jgi:hypothetical protein
VHARPENIASDRKRTPVFPEEKTGQAQIDPLHEISGTPDPIVLQNYRERPRDPAVVSRIILAVDPLALDEAHGFDVTRMFVKVPFDELPVPVTQGDAEVGRDPGRAKKLERFDGFRVIARYPADPVMRFPVTVEADSDKNIEAGIARA